MVRQNDYLHRVITTPVDVVSVITSNNMKVADDYEAKWCKIVATELYSTCNENQVLHVSFLSWEFLQSRISTMTLSVQTGP